MTQRVVVLGGGVAGLATAIGLARRDFAVTVVERDPTPETESGDEAFLTWERRSVPQFTQAHFFSARTRTLLLSHAPEVVERLHADGIEEFNFFKMLAPPEVVRPDDDDFTGLMTRRPGFELALRRIAEGEPGVELLSPVVASHVLVDDAAHPSRIVGLRLDDGRELAADIVIDCGGRRSPIPRWLADLGIPVPQTSQECGATYYSRYFRRNPQSQLPLVATLGVRSDGPGLFFAGFMGDHDTYGILIMADPTDEALRVLRHTPVWEAVARSMPTVAPWVDPANGSPLNDVQVMTGHENLRRYYVVDGKPLVLGLLPVGDALCTTNPQYGWGASMALTYAFAAVDVIGRYSGDLQRIALEYDAAVAPEADGVYRESAAMDRARLYRWRGIPVPADDADEMERQELIECVAAGSLRDVDLGRAQLRRINLVERPDAVFDDPIVLARATKLRDKLRARMNTGPTREDLLEVLAAASASPE